VFTNVRHLSIWSQVNPVHTTSILILLPHSRVSLPNGLSYSGLHTRFVYLCIISPTRATQPTHHTFLVHLPNNIRRAAQTNNCTFTQMSPFPAQFTPLHSNISINLSFNTFSLCPFLNFKLFFSPMCNSTFHQFDTDGLPSRFYISREHGQTGKTQRLQLACKTVLAKQWLVYFGTSKTHNNCATKEHILRSNAINNPSLNNQSPNKGVSPVKTSGSCKFTSFYSSCLRPSFF
jgi:hypothetical protein